jgi:hypothetical protein
MARRSEERTRFLKNLLITAVEGGIGYWSYVRRYDYKAGTVEVADNTECEWGDSDEEINAKLEYKPVTYEDMARGINLICSGECKYADNAQYVEYMRKANRENDAGTLDAGDADNVLQAALFGEVVYG